MSKIQDAFLKIGSVDRRWIFLIIALVVIVPLLIPVGLPIRPTDTTKNVYDAIEALPTGSKVLLSIEYSPSTRPEIHPMNVAVLANDGSVEVSWDSPPGGVEYSDQWVSYDDGTFEDAIVFEAGGQGYLGNNFGMPYGVETVTVHAARVWASNAGTTTLAGFAVVGGFPSPTPLYELTISTDAESFTSEIPLDWEFQSSFVIALLVTDVIGLGIDESSAPSSSSWSNLGGWSSWSEVAANTDGISDGEFGIQARITSIGGSSPTFNVYRDPGLDGSSYQLMFNGTGISQTSYSDNIVDNGVEYCYRIASVYDEAVSEQTAPQCGLPISNTVYDIIYDDGTSEDVMPVGNGNYVASKFTPEGYRNSNAITDDLASELGEDNIIIKRQRSLTLV